MRIFGIGVPSKQLVRLQRIAAHFGIPATYIDLGNSTESELVARMTDEDVPAVLDIASLSSKDNLEGFTTVVSTLAERNVAILLFATTDTPRANALLRCITNGEILSTESITCANKVRFAVDGQHWTGPLSNHSYERRSGSALGFRFDDSAVVKVVMSLDHSPSFVCLPSASRNFFAWCSREVFDIQKPLSAELEFEQAKDEYIPAIVFLRNAGGERCWHNPHVDAGFVIDDPLLQEQYGFINFPDLLDSARRHNYRVTLAFIPWNQRRTKQADAQRFVDHSDCFGVCVHGCDHNNNEYGLADYDTLLAKNERAIDRMDRHRDRTGIEYEPLVVCPQEKCSLEGWKAFADCHDLLAMVNTGCMPRNLTEAKTCAADLLTPAQDAFFGFPIFKRHYWGNDAPFGTDLFLGKPAILVEHHQFFQRGLKPLEDFVDNLSSMAPSIQWRPLTTVALETHWRRTDSPRHQQIRFFARQFDFYHEGSAQTYRLQKRIPDPGTVQSVLVNGLPTEFLIQDEFVTFEIGANSPEAFHVAVMQQAKKPTKSYGFGLKYQVGVALRRTTSEIRDNVISKSPTALRAGRKMMSTFGLTGKS